MTYSRTVFRRFSLLSAVWLLAACSQGYSADWPQWRGPQQDGVCTETGLLQKWDKDGPPLVWKASGLGNGYSSVSVADGRIFSMGAIKGSQHLVALDQKTGDVLWTAEVGGGGGSNCTPTYDDGLVYALGTKGDLVCVDAKNGELQWRKNFGQDFGGQMMSGWGYSESPLIDGDHLVCTPGAQDAAIAALDKKTGETVWKASIPDLGRRGRDGAGYSSIVIAEVGGLRQYVQMMGRGVIGVAAKDGRFLWGYNRVANGTANIPTPIVKDNYIFCSSGYGTGSALLKLTEDNGKIDVEEVYFLNGRTLQNHHGGMVRVGDYIYCGHGHNNGFPVCVEMMTGKIMWNPGRGPGSGSAAIVYADGQLYFRYENRVMALIEASPKAYKLNGVFELPTHESRSWPHPVISDGKLYLRAGGDLLCYDVKQK